MNLPSLSPARLSRTLSSHGSICRRGCCAQRLTAFTRSHYRTTRHRACHWRLHPIQRSPGFAGHLHRSRRQRLFLLHHAWYMQAGQNLHQSAVCHDRSHGGRAHALGCRLHLPIVRLCPTSCRDTWASCQVTTDCTVTNTRIVRAPSHYAGRASWQTMLRSSWRLSRRALRTRP